MKKSILAWTLFTAGIANAAGLTVSATHDNDTRKEGVRVEVSKQVRGVSFPVVFGVTHVSGVYTRYNVSAEKSMFNLGPIGLKVTSGGVYQNSNVGADGYGLTVGAKATLPLSKSVDLVGGVDRFFGQDRIKGYNATVGSLGVSVKF